MDFSPLRTYIIKIFELAAANKNHSKFNFYHRNKTWKDMKPFLISDIYEMWQDYLKKAVKKLIRQNEHVVWQH